MEKKDTVSYRTLFTKLRELIPNVHVNNFMTDYEAATRKAIREIFPNSRLSGCFFHYVQAIVKRFRRYKLDDDKFSLAKEKVGDAFSLILWCVLKRKLEFCQKKKHMRGMENSSTLSYWKLKVGVKFC